MYNHRHFFTAIASLLWTATLSAQAIRPPSITTTVPRLVRINSTFHPADGASAAQVEGAILSIYASETGGTPLWQETQNITVDSDGHYSLLLGATRNEGLPMELFASGDPRWLGVQVQRAGEVEGPRVLLASVPYALKAADAETLGGLPASAYVLNPSSAASGPAAADPSNARSNVKSAPRFTSAGTTNSIPVFTDNAGDIGNSALYENGTRIGLGTTNPRDFFHVAFTDTTGGVTGYAVQNLGSSGSSYSGMLFYDQNGAIGNFTGFNNSTHEYRINNVAKTGATVDGSINFMINASSKFLVRPDGDVDIPGSIRKNGALFIHNLGTGNLSLGTFTIPAGSTGSFNTAVGGGALENNTSGGGNTATGFGALDNNTSGTSNTADGELALEDNTMGGFNTATGADALGFNTTGSSNTATGTQALQMNVSGNNNTAVGSVALQAATGSNNIALGYSAGSSIASGSNNIDIGHFGNPSDSNTTRIGFGQSAFFASGIFNVTTGQPNGAMVVVDESGQLGTMLSSRRFKEDIQDMGDASDKLMRLRPVTYRYKRPYKDGSKPLDYGLVAEEVAEVYPDLVVRNKDGQIETVQYQKLAPMLLNELQKQHAEAVRENEHAQHQDETIRQLQEQNVEMAARLAALEALLSNQTVRSSQW